MAEGRPQGARTAAPEDAPADAAPTAQGPATPAGPLGLPRTVWALGFVSLFMDTSSELIHALLPVFVVTTLGAGALALGVIEGIAEATASLLKPLSGWLSDRVGRRRPLVLAGYGLAALSKPLFALAQGVGTLVLARLLDRIGKGIRGAPRDALIADVTPEALRGRAYALRQALDTVGAVVGPLAASALMVLLAGDVRAVYAFAVLPALLSVLVIVLFVREPERPRAAAGGDPRAAGVRLADLRALPAAFWLLLAAAGLAAVARLTEAFVILRLHGLGLAAAQTPLVLAALSVVYAAFAYPCGVLADRMGRSSLLIPALLVLVAALSVLALADSIAAGFAGVALYGLFLAASQGLFAALVADAAPAHLRGSAFGLYHGTMGIAALAAGVGAGVLWDLAGPRTAFAAAALLALAALAAGSAARRAFSRRSRRAS